MRVIIIGAGPAGLISALNLIAAGISPVVLEKQLAIRSTACGEACDLKSLDKIPFNSNPYICRKVKGAKLIYPAGTSSYISKSSVTLERTNWLKGMAHEIEARDGQVRLGSEVVAIREGSLQMKNGERLDYDVLIGADGPNSGVARHLGIKHQFTAASQYKLVHDTSGMDYLEFYIDRRFSPGYCWIFPKDGVINVGLEGNFAQLYAFLRHKGLNDDRIIKRESGVTPTSGIQRLAQGNIALIGDAAAMLNPFSGGGLTPLVHAARLLTKHINNLEGYENEVKRHPMASPVLLQAKRHLLELGDRELADLLSLLTEPRHGGLRLPAAVRALKHPSLLLKLKALVSAYRALRISTDYGW